MNKQQIHKYTKCLYNVETQYLILRGSDWVDQVTDVCVVNETLKIAVPATDIASVIDTSLMNICTIVVHSCLVLLKPRISDKRMCEVHGMAWTMSPLWL